ncbi:MAG: bacteriocin family protein, partial [Deltaproteobacteria bacterium]|nr:bacteriocin family protein [Deltaproteobacteria bacterium]
ARSRRRAHKAAAFEERAIYLGFEPGRIAGLRGAGDHAPISFGDGLSRRSAGEDGLSRRSAGEDSPLQPAGMLEAITRAMLVLHDAGVSGPFQLVLGPEPYKLVLSDNSTYPLRQQLSKLLDGPTVYSPVLGQSGFLVSARGGDFELTVGQDLAIGYEGSEGDRVHLFLLETFTFRVLGPEAVVALG